MKSSENAKILIPKPNLRKNAGTLLAIGASVGVVLTAVETGKAAIKAEKPVEPVELNKDIPDSS